MYTQRGLACGTRISKSATTMGWHMTLFGVLIGFVIAIAAGLELAWLDLRGVVAFVVDLGSIWIEEI